MIVTLFERAARLNQGVNVGNRGAGMIVVQPTEGAGKDHGRQ